MLIGDKSTNTPIPYERFDGEVLDLPTQVELDVKVSGTVGDNVTLNLGTPSQPNVEPISTHNRPTKYVPLKVAVYDLEASRALKMAQLENPDNTLTQDSSVYRWPYRPEMMYAVFDLDVTEITRTPTGDDGEAGDPIDITGSTTPTITAGDAELAIVQDLIASIGVRSAYKYLSKMCFNCSS